MSQRGFGMAFDTQTGAIRRWYIGSDGVKRWADNDQPVVDDAAPDSRTGGRVMDDRVIGPLARLAWCAESHLTREYRTVTFGESDAKAIRAHIEGLEADLQQREAAAQQHFTQALTNGGRALAAEARVRELEDALQAATGDACAWEYWRDRAHKAEDAAIDSAMRGANGPDDHALQGGGV